jgi:hypothetical protein
MKSKRRFLMVGVCALLGGALVWWLNDRPATESRSFLDSEVKKSTSSPIENVDVPEVNEADRKNKIARPSRSVAATLVFKDWEQVRDPFTGQVRTYSGGKFELNGKEELEKAENFVKSYAEEIFGVAPSDLVFAKSSKAARLKVTYQQMFGGYPVYGSTLALLFEDGELRRVQNDLQSQPQLPVKTNWKFEDVLEAYRQKPNGGLREQSVIEKVALANDPALTPRLILYPSGQGLIFVYQFYVDEEFRGRAPARAMVLFDPSGLRVIQKTSMHIE